MNLSVIFQESIVVVQFYLLAINWHCFKYMSSLQTMALPLLYCIAGFGSYNFINTAIYMHTQVSVVCRVAIKCFLGPVMVLIHHPAGIYTQMVASLSLELGCCITLCWSLAVSLVVPGLSLLTCKEVCTIRSTST